MKNKIITALMLLGAFSAYPNPERVSHKPLTFKLSLQFKIPDNVRDSNSEYANFLHIVFNNEVPVACVPLFKGNKILASNYCGTASVKNNKKLAPIVIPEYKDNGIIKFTLNVTEQDIAAIASAPPNAYASFSEDQGIYVDESSSSVYFVTNMKMIPYQGNGTTTAKPLDSSINFPSPSNQVTMLGELTFNEGIKIFEKFEMGGPNLGFVSKKGETLPAPLLSYVRYNRRYWSEIQNELNGIKVRRPKLFTIHDGFFVDDNLSTYKEGLKHVARLGANTLFYTGNSENVAGSHLYRTEAMANGMSGINFNVYANAECLFNVSPEFCSTKKKENAYKKRVEEVLKANYTEDQIKLVRYTDEPNWSFPYYSDVFNSGKVIFPANPRFTDDIKTEQVAKNIEDFKNYIKSKNISSDTEIDTIIPGFSITRNSFERKAPILGFGSVKGAFESGDLLKRKIYYWSQKYFSHNFSKAAVNNISYLNESSEKKALNTTYTISNIQNDFLHIGGIKNNLANRLTDHVNYPDSPPRYEDMGYGGPDFFRVFRDKSFSMLWGEDWNTQNNSDVASFQSSMLKSAAKTGDTIFGTFVVARQHNAVEGKTPREMRYVQKVIAAIGHGAKHIGHYMFGPEYVFQKNSYSDTKTQMFKAVALSNDMIGKSEEITFPGKPYYGKVAILLPQSAQIWNLRDVSGERLKAQEVLALSLGEHSLLFRALQHANIPVIFIDEESDSTDLAQFKVIYAIGENIPSKLQKNLSDWVSIKGGTLVLSPHAGIRDEYDSHSSVLESLAGITYEDSIQGMYLNSKELATVTNIKTAVGRIDSMSSTLPNSFIPLAYLPRASFSVTKDSGVEILANHSFQPKGKDLLKEPAFVKRKIGLGSVYTYAIHLGFNYEKEGLVNSLRISTGLDLSDRTFSTTIRDWITLPVREAIPSHLVSVYDSAMSPLAMIETPVLSSISADGKTGSMAIIVVDWSSQGRFEDPAKSLKIKFKLPFDKQKVFDIIQTTNGKKVPFTIDDQKNYVINANIANVDILQIKTKK